MFTGLIQDVGTVESIEVAADGMRLRIATRLGGQLAAGDSVALNGVCLTATSAAADRFEAEAMKQTLSLTSLAGLEAGERVNLEPAMKASDRFGGHIVQGHVDGVGEVISVNQEGFSRRLRVALGAELLRYVVARGSIALDGVSLTIADLGDSWAEVSLVPETLQRTTLGEAEVGRKLNVECDLVAKYLERLVAPLAGKERA